MSRLSLGFSSVKELTSYIVGLATLYYGVVEAAADRQLVVIGAGLGLLGLPVVGSLFEKKIEPPPPPPPAPPAGGPVA